MKHQLYGDGIHDDTAAIQELIDSGAHEVCLPDPKEYYLISKPLELPSHFRLVLPRFAEIRLAKGSDCVMLQNRLTYLPNDTRITKESSRGLWNYVPYLSAAPAHTCTNIEVVGGIWNFNNREQMPNPIATGDYGKHFDYTGFGFFFFNVNGLRLANMTLKDPINFAVNMDVCSYFTVENILFDFNDGNPNPINMDGIHLDGNCHYGTIRNLKGNCYDDLVALNAHEGTQGDITNVEINGIYADYCHSAVRLLLVNEKISNIHISNVFGSYYNYTVGITKFYPGEPTGCFDAISIDHVHAAKALPIRKGEFQQPPRPQHNWPVIWVQGKTVVKNLSIRNVHRREYTLPLDTVHIAAGALVHRLILDNITTENYTGEPLKLFHNCGTVKYLCTRNLDAQADQAFVNDGIIETHVSDTIQE